MFTEVRSPTDCLFNPLSQAVRLCDSINSRTVQGIFTEFYIEG